MLSRNVVIIGSGVIGLTIAHVLSADPALHITIIARDLPDDFDSQAWASPWAGANWSPIGAYDERIYKWELYTFNKLWDMIPSGLAMSLPSRIYFSDAVLEDPVSKTWWKDIVRNFHVLPAEDLPPNTKTGLGFFTVAVNPKFYLSWLKSELDARGVKFVRKHVASLDDAAAYAGPDDAIIINATGLGAKSLIGVEDLEVFPIRGQVIIVDCPELKEFLGLYGSSSTGDVPYIIPRPGDGTAILGGTFLSDVWDTSIDFSVAKDIFARCAMLESTLDTAKTRIVSHRVGLRPSRRGGPRVEAEWVDLPLKGDLVPRPRSSVEKKQLVIHAYGLGAAGYQRSWGVAEEVFRIVKENCL